MYQVSVGFPEPPPQALSKDAATARTAPTPTVRRTRRLP
jgi:hypothetical protein